MFNFKITPLQKTEEQKQKEDLLIKEYAEKNRRKALSADMQSNVLSQLANTQPTNSGSQPIPPQNVESKQGW